MFIFRFHTLRNTKKQMLSMFCLNAVVPNPQRIQYGDDGIAAGFAVKRFFDFTIFVVKIVNINFQKSWVIRSTIAFPAFAWGIQIQTPLLVRLRVFVSFWMLPVKFNVLEKHFCLSHLSCGLVCLLSESLTVHYQPLQWHFR